MSQWRINHVHPTVATDDKATHPLHQVAFNIYARKKGLEPWRSPAPSRFTSFQLRALH